MRIAAGAAGAVLYLLTGVLYLGSGLVMPYPLVMWILWAAGWVIVLRVYRRAPAWTAAVAAGAVSLWAAIVSFGEWVFGWTA